MLIILPWGQPRTGNPGARADAQGLFRLYHPQRRDRQPLRTPAGDDEIAPAGRAPRHIHDKPPHLHRSGTDRQLPGHSRAHDRVPDVYDINADDNAMEVAHVDDRPFDMVREDEEVPFQGTHRSR